MKNIYYLFFFTIILFHVACNKEDRICVKSDFIGDFVGQTVCKNNGVTGQPVPSVIKVSDGNAENELTLDIDGFTIGVIIDGCDFLGTDKNADVDIIFTGNLNGRNLKIKLEGTVFNTVIDCESEGEKN